MGNQQSSSEPIDSLVGTPSYMHENEDIREGFTVNRIPSDNVCGNGNSGFPVLIAPFGKTGTNTVVEDYSPDRLSLQFFQGDRKYIMDNTTNSVKDNLQEHTFIYEGDQYYLTDICLRKPMHQNLANVSPMFELQFWGKPSTGGSKSDYVVLIIPIYGSGIGQKIDVHGKAFQRFVEKEDVNLQNLIPVGADVKYYTYMTCLEFEDSPNSTTRKTIGVAYWENPIKIGFPNTPEIFAKFKYGLSARTIQDIKPLFRFSLDADGGKSNPEFSNTPINGVYETYTNLPIAEKDFKERFRLISGFNPVAQKRTEKAGYAKNYKCIPLNPTKDISTDKNGEKRIMIDPKTGDRLDQELVAADESLRGEINKPSISAGTITKWIVIFIGTMLGLIFIAYAVKFIVGFVGKTPPEIDVENVSNTFVEAVAKNTVVKNVVTNVIRNTAKNTATSVGESL